MRELLISPRRWHGLLGVIFTPPTLSELNVSVGYVCGRTAAGSGGGGRLWLGRVGCVPWGDACAANVRPEVVGCRTSGPVADHGNSGRVGMEYERGDGVGAERRGGGGVRMHSLMAHSVTQKYRCRKIQQRYNTMHK